MIRVLQKILIKKGVFQVEEGNESALIINVEELMEISSSTNIESPRDTIINLSNSNEDIVYDIRRQSGNLIYKEIFELNTLNKKYASQFFAKYNIVIKTDEFTVIANNYKVYAEQYKKRLLNFNGTSTIGVISKKDKTIKLAFNTVGGKKQTFNMSYSTAKCKDYIVNTETEDVMYGKFNSERIRVIGASMYRNSKVGNSTDFSSDKLQKIGSFIKLR